MQLSLQNKDSVRTEYPLDLGFVGFAFARVTHCTACPSGNLAPDLIHLFPINR